MKLSLSADNVIKSGLWIFGLSGVTFIINFLVNLYTAKTIGPSIIGTYILYSTLQSIIAIFISIPINTVYIQKNNTFSLFDSCWFLCAIASIINVLMGLITTLFINELYDKLILILLNINQVFIIYSGLYLSILEKKINYKTISILNIISTFISSVLCLSIIDTSLVALIAKDISYSMITLMCGIYLSKKTIPSTFNKKEIIEIFRSLMHLILMRGAESSYFKLPIYFFGINYGDRNLGILSQAIYLSSIQNAIFSPIIQGPVFSYISNITDSAKEYIVCNYAAIMLIFSGLFYFAIISNFNHEIIFNIYGHKWIGLEVIIKEMCLYSCFLTVFNLNKVILIRRKKEYIVTLSYIINMILLIVSIYFINHLNLSVTYQKILSLNIALSSIYMLIINNTHISRIIISIYICLLYLLF